MSEKLRGHDIYLDSDGKYRYVDNGEETAISWQNRNCGHCQIENRPDGHDACLGELQGVMNACCGHGIVKDAYIQFDNGSIFRGEEAINFFKQVIIQ